MKRKHKNIVIENLEITGIEHQGKGVARYNGKVVFVDGALPGDVVNARFTANKKDYATAEIVGFQQYAPQRQNGFCSHFGICGGCKWQSINYEQQLRYKESFVKEAVCRIARMDESIVLPIIGCDNQQYYRNKLEFTFSDAKWLTEQEVKSEEVFTNRNALGFHIPGRFDKVLDIDHCYLQPEPSNTIRNFVRDYALRHAFLFFNIRNKEGLLRNLMIRTTFTGEVMVVMVFFKNDEIAIRALMMALQEQFPQITSLNYVVNSGANDMIHAFDVVCFSGKPFIIEKLGHLQFKIGPKSFFQTNTAQTQHLYEIVKEFASLTGNEIVYDLYTGIGSIALYVADRCRKVAGIEQNPDAIEDAKQNAKLNGINNCEFFTGDVRDMFNHDFYATHGAPDLVITDPPRAGMHGDVVKTFIEMRVPKIVYVSCNPSTQARDLALLAVYYSVNKIQPIDMFPQTHHIESVALLKLKV